MYSRFVFLRGVRVLRQHAVKGGSGRWRASCWTAAGGIGGMAAFALREECRAVTKPETQPQRCPVVFISHRKQSSHFTDEVAGAGASGFAPDSVSSERTEILLSTKFGGEIENQARQLHKELCRRGFPVKMVQAEPGQDFGRMTAERLGKMRLMIAFCPDNYAEQLPHTSVYSSHAELKYAFENKIPIIPVRMGKKAWPPTPDDGAGTALCGMVFNPSLVRIEWQDKPWHTEYLADAITAHPLFRSMTTQLHTLGAGTQRPLPPFTSDEIFVREHIYIPLQREGYKPFYDRIDHDGGSIEKCIETARGAQLIVVVIDKNPPTPRMIQEITAAMEQGVPCQTIYSSDIFNREDCGEDTWKRWAAGQDPSQGDWGSIVQYVFSKPPIQYSCEAQFINQSKRVLLDVVRGAVSTAVPTAVSHWNSPEGITHLNNLLQRFEITIADAPDLACLTEYDIVVIADDSGSMNLPAGGRAGAGPRQHRATRWSELQDTLGTVIDIASVFHPSGIDIHFLNRPPVTAISSQRDPRFLDAMRPPPSGSTPLKETFNNVVRGVRPGQRPVLLIIATDGEPNGGPMWFIRDLEDVISKRTTQHTFKVQILACTDDNASIGWLNQLDRRFAAVDVTDDYVSEQAEVLRIGKYQQFTRSDWVIKALLGPLCTKFDTWDEHKIRYEQGVLYAQWTLLTLATCICCFKMSH